MILLSLGVCTIKQNGGTVLCDRNHVTYPYALLLDRINNASTCIAQAQQLTV